jgi:hypothetical protein
LQQSPFQLHLDQRCGCQHDLQLQLCSGQTCQQHLLLMVLIFLLVLLFLPLMLSLLV